MYDTWTSHADPHQPISSSPAPRSSMLYQMSYDIPQHEYADVQAMQMFVGIAVLSSTACVSLFLLFFFFFVFVFAISLG